MDPEHLEILRRGVDAWNDWRRANPSIVPDLSDAALADLRLPGIDLHEANLTQADLSRCFLKDANLQEARCANAIFRDASLVAARGERADLSDAVLETAWLVLGTWSNASFRKVAGIGVNLQQCDLSGADLTEFFTHGGSFIQAKASRADFSRAYVAWTSMYDAQFVSATFSGGEFEGSDFHGSDLSGAVLSGANLKGAVFRAANLSGADLQRSDLSNAVFVQTDITGANLSQGRIHGVSCWDLQVDDATRQEDMVITPAGVPEVVVDDIEVAQFVYLLLNNQKIRNVIQTVGSRGVLILGRFTERKHVLEALRLQVRRHGYVPIVFDFERPSDRDFTETIRILAGMSRFVIADITRPRSVPLEAQAAIPDYMIPFVPIIERGEEPFSMFRDLWQKHGAWVLEPLRYDSVQQLEQVFERAILAPANERLLRLRQQKAAEMPVRDASQYE